MAERPPQEVMEDRRIAGVLNDLFDACFDANKAANSIAGGKTFKALDSSTKSTFNKYWDTMLAATEAAENERSRCLDGKAKDLNTMKTLLTKQLDALDTIEDITGRMQVLEDKALDAILAAFLAMLVLTQGANGDLLLMQKKSHALLDKMAKAIRACRDARIKMQLGAGMAAIAICLVPLGGGIAVIGGIALFGVETALGYALAGNEETKVKKAWNLASGVGAMADGLDKMPKSFGPAMILATGAVDMREVFKNERDLAAFQKELKSLSADISKLAPKAGKQFRELEKLGQKIGKELPAAISAVKSFKPTKGKYHSLPSMLK